MIKTVLVNTAPTNAKQAILKVGPLTIRAALGKSSLGILKREGDGKTPHAVMKLLYGYWRTDRGPRPVTSLPMRPIKRDDLWCDESGHAAYNRPVREPFKPSHEKMWRDDSLYDICLVMDWNVSERKRNGGSAIFLHIARPGYTPTEGCIAVSKRDMRKLLCHANRQTIIRIA